jgi:DNA-directed RNA polymerase omega subunit
MNNSYFPVEKMLGASEGSVFKLTALAAKRAMQLADGAKPLIAKPNDKVLETALEEILEGKVVMIKSKQH